MKLDEMITRRRSCRSYSGIPVSEEILEQIRTFPMKPLFPEIPVHWEILTRNQIKCLCPWTTPQVIAIYSEEKEGYLENVGFLFQQMDLYLQSISLGACWLGMGKLDPKAIPARNDGLSFVIMLAFGHPKGEFLRKELSEFKRRSLKDISSQADPCLEPARLAPSSVNSQPWYFTHDGALINAYCAKKGILKAALGDMNRIDMGIALAHLYVTHPDSFHYRKLPLSKELKGYEYIGSFVL